MSAADRLVLRVIARGEAKLNSPAFKRRQAALEALDRLKPKGGASQALD